MASTIVEFRAPTGMTLDLDLYPYGSDTIANGASGDAATEQTNRKGVYQATVTEALTGWHTAHIMSGATVIAVWDVYLVDDTNTHRCFDRKQPAPMAESYAATLAEPTEDQALYEILQNLTESANSGLTRTVKKRDQATNAKTYTYDDASDPTSITAD